MDCQRELDRTDTLPFNDRKELFELLKNAGAKMCESGDGVRINFSELPKYIQDKALAFIKNRSEYHAIMDAIG